MGWCNGWMRCSWSALTSSAAVSAIGSSPADRALACGPSVAIVPVGNDDRAMLLPSVSIEPRARPTAIAPAHVGSATLEIVPLLAVEGPEKFRVVEPVELAPHPARALDEAGIPAESEERPSHARVAEKGRPIREQAMQTIAPHQRAVDEEERRPGQLPSTAWRTAARNSGSGRAPSNCTRSLM